MDKKGKLTRTLITIFLIFLFIFPVFVMLNTSLQRYEDIRIWPPAWFQAPLQWKNYFEVIFGDKSIMMAFKNSLFNSITVMFICVSVGSLAAYAVSRFNFIGRKEFLMIIIITQMFSGVVLINAMYIIFKDLNLLNTRLALIIANTTTSLPTTIWLLYSYFSQIPGHYEEAAWVDGSSRFQAIKNIVIPIAAPGIVTAGLFAFLACWGDLMFANAFITSSELRTISQALGDFQELYKTTWETQMAASVITTIPPFIIFSTIQQYLAKGLVSQGVKG